MIKISSRLKAIADLIAENSRIIDIGCDHGLLDIYLARNKNCYCLASDISEKCINKAKENVNKYGLVDKIELLVSDGLNNIEYTDDDYIVISGMGFRTITDILKNHHPNKLIIQSNNDIEDLKRYLLKKYIIKNEKIILEHNIYYVIMYLEKGKKKYRYSDYIIGLNKTNYDYINYLFDKYNCIYQKLPKKYFFKRFVLYRKITILKKFKKH